MNLEELVKHYRKCAEQAHKDSSPCRARMYECDARIAELKIKIREEQDDKACAAEQAGYDE